MALSRQFSLPRGLMMGLGQLARVARDMGDWQASARYWEEGLALARALGDAWWVARKLAFGASLRLHDDNLDGARTLLLESLHIRQVIGDQDGIASCLEGFSELAAASEQARLVLLLAGAAAEQRRRLAVPRVGSTRWPGPAQALECARCTLGGMQTSRGQPTALSPEQAVALARGSAGPAAWVSA